MVRSMGWSKPLGCRPDAMAGCVSRRRRPCRRPPALDSHRSGRRADWPWTHGGSWPTSCAAVVPTPWRVTPANNFRAPAHSRRTELQGPLIPRLRPASFAAPPRASSTCRRGGREQGGHLPVRPRPPRDESGRSVRMFRPPLPSFVGAEPPVIGWRPGELETSRAAGTNPSTPTWQSCGRPARRDGGDASRARLAGPPRTLPPGRGHR